MNNNFDYQTSTVDGARGFADMHAEPERCDYVPDEFEDESEDENEEYEEEYENECNCSCPWCDCGGMKRGGI